MINTTSVKDRSFVMNISNGNSISIETRNNKHIIGISIWLTEKHKRLVALNLEFVNGKFVKFSDDLDKIPKYKEIES